MRLKVALACLFGLAVAVPTFAQMPERPLRVAEMWELATLDPVSDDGTFIKEKAMVAETLTNANPDFTLAPGLAVSWTQTSQREWRFVLREGVRFHDGTPFDAAATAQSIERALAGNPGAKGFSQIEAVRVADARTLTIVTRVPYSPLPAAMSLARLAIVSPTSTKIASGAVDVPVGTGPYRVTAWDAARQTVTLARNDSYWGEKPAIARIEFRAIPDPATRSLELQTGGIDFAPDVPTGDFDLLTRRGYKVLRETTARLYALNFGRIDGTPYADPRVRQAISHAIDREALAKHVLAGVGSPAGGVFAPNMDFAAKGLDVPAYDPERARQLLREAGVTSLTPTLFTYANRPGLVPLATAIQAQLAAVGINAQLRVTTFAAITREIKPGDMRLAALATALFPHADYFLRQVYRSDGGWNTWGFADQAIDAALDRATAASDPAQARAAYDEIQRRMYDAVPIVPVAYYGVSIAMSSALHDFTFNPIAHDYMLDSRLRFAPQ